MLLFVVFFVFKQKTAYEMRISDWSSDVCSSDLWASRKLKRAVKYLPERSEAFVSDVQGRDNVSYAEAAVDADGVIQALRVTTYAALGGYLRDRKSVV